MTMQRNLAISIILWCSLTVLSGCGEFFDGGTAGPCILEQEPVLWIVDATDEGGQSLSTIEISQVTFNGEPVEVGTFGFSRNFSVIEAENQENGDEDVEPADMVYECELPCAFGEEDGTYQFVASVSGQEPKTVEVDAEYGTREGGCPGFIGDGTEIEIGFE